MQSHIPLTAERQIELMANGKTINLGRIHPCGSLYARKGTHGDVTFTWRFTFQTANDAEVVGLWDRAADVRCTQKTPGGWTVRAATRQAEEWAREHTQYIAIGGFRAMDRIDREDEAEAGAALTHSTLGQLMEDYAAYLEGRGSHGSASDVRYAVRLYIELPHNLIFRKLAREVSQRDVITIMKLICEKLHHKTAAKYRGYLQTAYQRAIDAMSRPDLPEHFKAYRITHNVAKEVANAPGPRTEPKPIKALTVGQMRWYWSKIKNLKGIEGATLRLQLLSGGQRPAQLVRLKRANITDKYFTIYDPKGRDSTPRPHVIPLTPTIAKTLAELGESGIYPMSATRGRTPFSAQTLTNWSQEVVGDAIPGFQLKWIRSGVESVLSEWQILEEHRGRLQSHGIKGVQAKHYNAFDFFKPKFEALELLELVLNNPTFEAPSNPMLEILRLQQELADAKANSQKAA